MKGFPFGQGNPPKRVLDTMPSVKRLLGLRVLLGRRWNPGLIWVTDGVLLALMRVFAPYFLLSEQESLGFSPNRGSCFLRQDGQFKR